MKRFARGEGCKFAAEWWSPLTKAALLCRVKFYQIRAQPLGEVVRIRYFWVLAGTCQYSGYLRVYLGVSSGTF